MAAKRMWIGHIIGGLTEVYTGALAPGDTVAIVPDSIPSHWEGKQHCCSENSNTESKTNSVNMFNTRPAGDEWYREIGQGRERVTGGHVTITWRGVLWQITVEL